MKKLLAAVLLAVPFTVQATDRFSMDYCKPTHALAEKIMGGRQKGASMVKFLEIAESTDIGFIRTLATIMVNEAFETPRYHTEENKQRAIQDFGNEMFKLCMEAMKENTK